LNIVLTIPEDFGRLSRDTELVVFRIVQECLTNVHRHSESKVATICITRERASISLKVQDEGKGISAEKLIELQSHGGGVGIRGMRERILQLGGDVNIRSEGRGTTISISIPLVNEAQSEPEQDIAQAQSAG
jgi:signal transduction histidine kinase